MKNKVKTIALFAISLLACILSIIAIFRPLPNTDKTQWREIYGYRTSTYYGITQEEINQYSIKYMYISYETDKVFIKTTSWRGIEEIKEYGRWEITYVDYMTY